VIEIEVIHPIPRDPIACACGADLELLEHPARIGCPKGCDAPPERLWAVLRCVEEMQREAPLQPGESGFVRVRKTPKKECPVKSVSMNENGPTCPRCEQPIVRAPGQPGRLPKIHDACLTPAEREVRDASRRYSNAKMLRVNSDEGAKSDG
jgi:hypothetical protein